MKPKNALFISAVLTAFVLTILGGVASTLNPTQASQVAVAASPTETIQITDVPTQPDPTVTASAPVGPEQAAAIAAEYMKKNDVYSVESTLLEGVPVFKVVFSSGDVVYLGLDGTVISTEKLQPTTVFVDPTAAPRKHKSNNNGATGASSGGNGGGSGGENEHPDEQETEHEKD